MPPSLAEKLTRLFDTFRDAEGHRFSDADVAAAVGRSAESTISANYIYLLRTGKRDNPTKRHLEALATFFRVSPSFFFDDDVGAEIHEELELLAALRDHGIRDIALRAASLTDSTRRSLRAILTELHDLERRSTSHAPSPPRDP